MTLPELSSAPADDVSLRLSNLRALLVLSMLMAGRSDEASILRLATGVGSSLGTARMHGVYLLDQGWALTAGATQERAAQADVVAQIAVLGATGGEVSIPGEPWGWAYPLRSEDGHHGYLFVGADAEPIAEDKFLLRVLAQQAGIALANARLHALERARSAELAAALAALERSTAVHQRLTQAAVDGGGLAGIAEAVHDVTGLSVALEDPDGALLAWGGPGRPEHYPRDPRAMRARLLEQARQAERPMRVGDRLLVVARSRDEVLGVMVLHDRDARSADAELMALEHGVTVLTLELSRLQSVAETELRLGRDLVDELVSGTASERVRVRAKALGHDLGRPHRVLVVRSRDHDVDDSRLFRIVTRAAVDTAVGSLVMARGHQVVVLAADDGGWCHLGTVIRQQTNGRGCRVGAGGVCTRLEDYPRSYREAELALRVPTRQAGQDREDRQDRVVCFDDLGVYQLLADVRDISALEQFARRWLGPLMDYDRTRGADLVHTLARFLDLGGSYDATADAIAVHRSTLKYRLQRIREISGHDLADPDTRFNLEFATRAWRTLLALGGGARAQGSA